MKRSSARQLEIDYTATGTLSGDGRADSTVSQADVEKAEPGEVGVAPLAEPKFGRYREIDAAASRVVGRLNAANISDLEYSQLLQERQSLLDKKFAGTITRRELNKLEYVRWSLDRIDDARHGADLDKLEAAVSEYEHFLAEVHRLDEQLKTVIKKGVNERRR